MNCPCGGSTKEGSHQVSGLKTAKEWSSKVAEKHLPIKVETDTCRACGRLRAFISSSDGRLLDRRG